MKTLTQQAIKKLPEITLLFWIMKICATTLGETAWDLFAQTLHIGYATTSIILFSLFVVALIGQLKSKKFHPLLYWTVILATSTAGTTMSDYMDRTLELWYVTGSAILITLLVSIIGLWYYNERSLSVSDAQTPRAEMFYWIAILVSNTLGTAFGDFLADSSGLGFAGWALVVSTSIALIALAYKYTKFSPIALFWLAFVLTRPLWATVGDFFTKTVEKGGLGFWTMWSSAVLTIVLVGMIIYQYAQKKKNIVMEDNVAEHDIAILENK
jgi:uncharacterized membrane-anchored protein